MVLSESAPHVEPGSAPGGWIEQIQLSLRLSRAGVLLFVDKARPQRLGELVRALSKDHPGLDVLTNVRSAADAKEGSVLVLCPKPEDASWLNLRRPLFSRLELKVVLWCDEATSSALVRNAADFMDWVTQRQECPDGPVMHAVHGIRKAVLTRAPAIHWRGPPTEETRRRIDAAILAAVPQGAGQKDEEALSAGVPRRRLSDWLVPTRDYVSFLTKLDACKDQCALISAKSAAQLRRARWGLAELRRTSPAVVVAEPDMPGYLVVHADLMSIADARSALAQEGISEPGCLAALTGLEPETVALSIDLIRKGHSAREIASVLRKADDPGAALALWAWEQAHFTTQDIVRHRVSAPAWRALEGHPDVVHGREAWNAELQRAFLAKQDAPLEALGAWSAFGTADPALLMAVVDLARKGPASSEGTTEARVISSPIEIVLRGAPSDATAWSALAVGASALGEGGAAALWSARALAIAARSEQAEDRAARAAEVVAGSLSEGTVFFDLLQKWSAPLRRQHRLSYATTIAMLGSIVALFAAGALKWRAAIPWVFGVFFVSVLFGVWAHNRLKRDVKSTNKKRWSWLGLSPDRVSAMPVRTSPDGRPDEGFAILQASLTEAGERFQPLFRSAEDARLRGDLDEARAQLYPLARSVESTFGDDHPLCVQIRLSLASVLLEQEQPLPAHELLLKIFKSGADLGPSPGAGLSAGEALLKLGRFADAEIVFRHLIDMPSPVAEGPGEPSEDAPHNAPRMDIDALAACVLDLPRGSLRRDSRALAALKEVLASQGRHAEAQAVSLPSA